MWWMEWNVCVCVDYWESGAHFAENSLVILILNLNGFDDGGMTSSK